MHSKKPAAYRNQMPHFASSLPMFIPHVPTVYDWYGTESNCGNLRPRCRAGNSMHTVASFPKVLTDIQNKKVLQYFCRSVPVPPRPPVYPAPNPRNILIRPVPACPRPLVLASNLLLLVLLSMQYIVLHLQTRLFVPDLLSAHLRTVP